jgi:hypothetical protein
MKKDLQQTVWDIQKWSDETFGSQYQRTIPILHHLKKEVPELIEALENIHNFEGTGKLDYSDRNGGNFILDEKSEKKKLELWHKVYEEFADCFMLLFDAATHFPMTVDTIQMQMERKLEINKKRKWGTPDENGVVEHIK